jgi:hypothetical protein
MTRLPAGGWGLVTISTDRDRHVAPLGLRDVALAGGYIVASFSPDGKWLAYSSAESGQEDVYVVDFPGLTTKTRISRAGGRYPAWRGDGREIYFLSPGGILMAAAVSAAPAFRVGAPVPILGGASEISYYAPDPDGMRFLVQQPARDVPLPTMKVLLNWPAAVRRRE